jgi:mono/diheme cytochrome c family protein
MRVHGSLLFALGALLSVALSSSTAFAKNHTQSQSEIHHGAEVFKSSRCFACHGEMGGGGMGPALAGDPMLAVEQFVIAQILIGRGAMPAFADKLSNDDIAAVAAYVRNSWGNDFGSVALNEVEATRQLMKRAAQVSTKVSSPQ